MKFLTAIFNFLVPILRRAIIQVAADELARVAYPERTHVRFRQRGTDRYADIPLEEVRQYAKRDVEATRRLFEDSQKTPHHYHDVVMVAFDLDGGTIEDVHEWLHDQMPEPGTHGDRGEIYLDAWWVANDDRFDGSDTDSAVFVTKGKQAEARELLRQHGLVN